MARVDTLPEYLRPLMDGVTVRTPYCAVCGRTYPLNQHHVVRRGAGKTDELWENEIAKKLVRKCAEARRESTEMRKQMFVEAMRGTEEHDEGCAKSIADLAAEKSREYTNMVYELLVRNN